MCHAHYYSAQCRNHDWLTTKYHKSENVGKQSKTNAENVYDKMSPDYVQVNERIIQII